MAPHQDLESARAGLSARRLIGRPRTDRGRTRGGEQGDQAIHLDRGIQSGRRSAFGQPDRRTRLSRPGRLPGHVPPGLSADRAHVPLCFVPSVAEARPIVRRRALRGSRPDGDAGPQTPGRDSENGRAVMRERTRLAECRLRAGTRGGPQNTPPSGASTPPVVPSASGASALRSATNRLDGLGSRSRSQRGARENSASSRSRRPDFQTESRALCSSLVRDDCRTGG